MVAPLGDVLRGLMATNARVRWGILGGGRIALWAHAPALHGASNACLRAIATRKAGTARGAADAAGAEVVYADYPVLLADPAIDAVYIGLPNGLHEAWTIAAARAGKHVLCDKSLALDLAAALRMRAACEEAGVRLMEGFMVRHHPQWTRVRRLLAEGAVGELRAIDTWLTGAAGTTDHRWSRALGGGALYDVTVYGVDLARFLTGEEPEDVRALGTRRGDVDASSVVALRFPSGVVATAAGSLVAAASQGVRITGTDGVLTLEQPVVTHFDPTRVHLDRAGARETWLLPGANHFLHQIEHFSACVLDPARPLGPGEDGVENARVCEAARRQLEA